MAPPTGLPPLRSLFFDDLKVGMTERLKKTIAASDVVGFAQLTGDRNPVHLAWWFDSNIRLAFRSFLSECLNQRTTSKH